MTGGRGRRDTGVTGFVMIDKPAGWTSHDVVARARRVLGTRKVGHAGTLDPLATGVLVLGIGRATKLLGMIAGGDKEYRATIRLGVTTHTDDREGEVWAQVPADHLTADLIQAAMAEFIGDISQRPSSVSAIKVDGRRAHERVRGGEHVELAARQVTVAAFELAAHRLAGPDTEVPHLDIEVRVVCGSGTYVRALARDLGSALGVGGHVVELRRTRLGPISVDECETIAQFEAAPDVVSLGEAATRWFPLVQVSATGSVDLRHGRAIDLPAGAASDSATARVLAADPGGEVVALVEPRSGMLAPVIVFMAPPAPTDRPVATVDKASDT